ncbi:uncharacterized protein LOC110450778 [Mizuhopecten yessoensis]|uniref:uncharacterized protein LOC110450778 n=1 Tax=Mizuhopecten yessoensis TaxID=6573 RepID=UPI000B45E5AF|nr:uncharacterized protein LOC110450778 [Mizuhopecten yessoensis]
MKITIIHSDSKRRSQIRLSERQTTGLSTLFKRFPKGTVIKRRGRTIDVGKECQLNKVFSDGDVVEAVYTPVVRTRRLWNGVDKSSNSCMITLDTVEPRAKMACGHAITPRALYDYCWYELEKGNSKITCPYVTNFKGETCGYKWNRQAITLSAAMSKTEKMLFQTKLDKNRIKQQETESKNVYPDDVMISLLHNSPKLYPLNTPNKAPEKEIVKREPYVR